MKYIAKGKPQLETEGPNRLGWIDNALCSHPNVDENLFNADFGPRVAMAKKICEKCKSKKDCLEFELDFKKHYKKHGVAGGMTSIERNELIHLRKEVASKICQVAIKRMFTLY